MFATLRCSENEVQTVFVPLELTSILFFRKVKASGPSPSPLSVDLEDETDVYFMAKSYFDLKEYDR